MWRLVVATAKHDIASLASMIAFYALFSLFPLLLLIIYVMSILLPNTHIETVLFTLLHPYFPALPDAREVISRNIARLSEIGERVGLVSAITLVWSATSGFIAVQQAMDVIWESAQRSFVTRRLISFLMLVVLLLIMMASAIMMAFYPAVEHVIEAHRALAQTVTLIHGTSRILFPLSLFLGFIIFYRYLPSKSMDWLSILPGALVATLAVDAGRQFFVWYAGHLVRYQMIYGTLAAFMLLVLWMYIASMLMLFGAEVSAAVHWLLTGDEMVSETGSSTL